MEEKKKKIEELEKEMVDPAFWLNKSRAQNIIKEINDLKDDLEGDKKYNKGSAIMTIFSGAGGDDAEDFSHILFEMYLKYFEKNGWNVFILHKNENNHGGFRNITLEINGKNVYGRLKKESGVHRLVRVSPFNAKKLRHTSFSMVEVIPKLEKVTDFEIPESEIEVEFSKSGGPGGQNVNKRETAVRVIHLPTKISVHTDSERSQLQNREKAMQIIKGKLFKLREEKIKDTEESMQVGKSTEIAWGNQIRSYVFHPYKMVKDHRTNVEIRDVESVLNGNIDEFIDAELK